MDDCYLKNIENIVTEYVKVNNKKYTNDQFHFILDMLIETVNPENIKKIKRLSYWFYYPNKHAKVICANIEFARFGILTSRNDQRANQLAHPTKLTEFLNKLNINNIYEINQLPKTVETNANIIDNWVDKYIKYNKYIELPISNNNLIEESNNGNSKVCCMKYISVDDLLKCLANSRNSGQVNEYALRLFHFNQFYNNLIKSIKIKVNKNIQIYTLSNKLYDYTNLYFNINNFNINQYLIKIKNVNNTIIQYKSDNVNDLKILFIFSWYSINDSLNTYNFNINISYINFNNIHNKLLKLINYVYLNNGNVIGYNVLDMSNIDIDISYNIIGKEFKQKIYKTKDIHISKKINNIDDINIELDNYTNIIKLAFNNYYEKCFDKLNINIDYINSLKNLFIKTNQQLIEYGQYYLNLQKDISISKYYVINVIDTNGITITKNINSVNYIKYQFENIINEFCNQTIILHNDILKDIA